MLRSWHASLVEAPARLHTRKNAPTRNVRTIDVNDPDAVRRRRARANRVLTILKAALNLAYRDGDAQSDEAWRRVKPFREADAPIRISAGGCSIGRTPARSRTATRQTERTRSSSASFGSPIKPPVISGTARLYNLRHSW
jgi:hypothetical protein